MATAAFVPSAPVDNRAATRRDIATMIGLFLVLSAAYWALVLGLCGGAGFPLDDSFIHLQFARNLYEDGQMAFNKGVPSSGSTAPLYPVLIAAVYCLVRNWYVASMLLGAACSVGTALAVYGILRSWTGRQDLARWGGLLTVLASPTVAQAYTGMESGAYSLLFLLGLWAYGPTQRRRLLGTGLFALCIWLRPEFLTMAPIVAVERLVAAYREKRRWSTALAAFLGDIWPQVAVWAGMVALYGAYHWHLDRHLVPNTFHAKAVAPNSIRPAWFDGLPAALSRGNWLHVLLAVTVWPTLVLFLAGVGLTVNCAPLGLGIRDSLTAVWRDEKRAASGRRLAVITLVGYPWLRGFVDPSGFILFQFQRYYAHLTPLFILAALGAWPVTGAVVRRKYWDWQGTPLRAQRFRSCCWGAMSGLLMAILCAVSVWNINSMQVPLGHWVRENTSSDQLVATNDIGAIGFVSERRILDTVGLVEPKLVEHYLAGGDLLGYLKSRDPAYVIIFPEWYKDLSSRADLLEEVHSVTLGLNVICGGSRMVVYRPHWKKGSG